MMGRKAPPWKAPPCAPSSVLVLSWCPLRSLCAPSCALPLGVGDLVLGSSHGPGDTLLRKKGLGGHGASALFPGYFGTLGVDGKADLFFINPNGIIFVGLRLPDPPLNFLQLSPLKSLPLPPLAMLSRNLQQLFNALGPDGKKSPLTV